ncbi:MAG: PA14 domain-containing protein [Planctomycetales bacterium]
MQLIDIDANGGATDSQINNTTEGELIRSLVNAQLSPGMTGTVNNGATIYNIVVNTFTTHHAMDFIGTTANDFNTDQFNFNSIVGTTDFLVSVTGGIKFDAGAYTIHTESDDGFSIKIAGVTFGNHSGAGGGTAIGNEIRFENPTGNSDHTAEFTLGGQLVTTIDGL